MRTRPFFLFSGYLVPDEHRVEFDAQCRRDVLARQRSSALFGPGIFGLVAASTLIANPSQLKLMILIAFAVILGASIGYRHHALNRFGKAVESPSQTDWLHLHLSLAFVTTVWGAFLAVALLQTPLREDLPLIYAGALGLTAGGVVSLAIKASLVRVAIIGLIVPSILVSLLGNSSFHPGMAALLAVFAFGMYWVSANARAEYAVAVVSNLTLQEQSEKLTRLTTLDWLTKVYNRSHFDQILGKELRRVARIGYPLSLLMIDIDHFKRINDTHGHLVGDKCLAATASQIRECLKRETDVLARFGGEEFCVLLPGMEQDDAGHLAETIRVHIEKSLIWHYNNPVTVTVSIGGATVNSGDTQTREAFLERSDQAMYEAKATGRNKVVWDDGLS